MPVRQTRSNTPAPDPRPRRWKECPLAQELFIIHNLLMKVGDRLVSDLGLTGSRWLLLGALERLEKPPMLSELSQDGLLSVQNVSRMVTAMESDGFIERFTQPGMGRAVFVRMTVKGRRVHQRAKKRGQAFSRAFLKGLAKSDIRRIERDLQRLTANLEREALRLAARGGRST